MSIWKRAMQLARHRAGAADKPMIAEWEIQEYVFKVLESEKGERGWTEAECVDAARWAARKVNEE